VTVSVPALLTTGKDGTMDVVMAMEPETHPVLLGSESDFEDFVVGMFRGDHHRDPPRGLTRYDLENIEAIVTDLRAMFGVTSREVLYQPGWQQLPNTTSIMDHLKNRDYQGAWGFIEIESGFLPA